MALHERKRARKSISPKVGLLLTHGINSIQLSLSLSLSLSLCRPVTDKIKEKQVGMEFPNFRRLPSSGVYFLQLNVGKNYTTILKLPGDQNSKNKKTRTVRPNYLQRDHLGFRVVPPPPPPPPPHTHCDISFTHSHCPFLSALSLCLYIFSRPSAEFDGSALEYIKP